jgi:pimeloyl-ACP methyl ester carboxylesterase
MKRSSAVMVFRARIALRFVTVISAIAFLTLLSQPIQAQSSNDSWINISRSFTDTNSVVKNFAFAPSNPDYLYARSCRELATQIQLSFVRSVDGGKVWTTVSSELVDRSSRPSCKNSPISEYLFIAVDPVNPDIVYEGDSYFVNKSVNGGRDWENVYGNEVRLNVFAIDPRNPSNLYLGLPTYADPCCPFYIFLKKTTDGGQIWTESSSGITFENKGRAKITTFLIDAKNSNIVYIGLKWDEASSIPRMFRSDNGGVNWRRVSLPSDVGGYSSIDSIAQAPTDANILYAAGRVSSNQYRGPILKSIDNGLTWLVVGHLPHNSEPGRQYANDLKIAVGRSNPSELYIGSFDGAFKSLNGGVSWNELSNGLPKSFGSDLDTTIEGVSIRDEVFATSNSSLSSRDIFKLPGKLEVVDPACSDAIHCNGDFFETDTGSVESPRLKLLPPKNLLTAKVNRIGAAADGVTTLLLRMRSDYAVTFTIKNPNGDEEKTDLWGILARHSDLSGGSSVLRNVDPVDTPDGKYVFVAYRVPKQLPALPSASNEITIEAVSSSNSDNVQRAKLTLRPPPVVIIHGLWSDSGKFERFGEYLHSKGYDVFLADHDSGSFDPTIRINSTFAQIDAAIRGRREIFTYDGALPSFRRAGYAVSQVDVIGHSLGALIARAVIAAPQYRKRENYLEGDIHKLITIGAPHDGSKLIDALVEHRCDIRPIYRNGRIEFFALEDSIGKLFGPYTPAMVEMQTASVMRSKLGRTTVPSHAIGTTAPSTNLTKAALALALRLYTLSSVDSLFVNPFDLRPGDHDLIVQLSSQFGGLDPSHTASFENIIHFYNPADLAANQPTAKILWEEAETLLNTSLDQPQFAEWFIRPLVYGEPKTCKPIFSLDKMASTVAASKTQQATVSLTPKDGEVVRPGQSFPVTFSVTGEQMNGAIVNVGGQPYMFSGAGPYTLSHPVPANFVGRIEIAATAFGEQNTYLEERYVVSQPLLALKELFAPVSQIEIDDRNPIQLNVTGVLEDGSQVNLTTSRAGTIYATKSGTNSVVSIGPEGFLVIQGPGQDSIEIANGEKKLSIPITVRLDFPAPAISSITPASVAENSGSVDITINGKDFQEKSLVYLNGEVRLPRFVSANQLVVQVSGEDVRKIYGEDLPASLEINLSVVNPSPSGGTSSTPLKVISARSSSARPKIAPRPMDGRPVNKP